MSTISNIDLHSHTNASDGALSPEQIVARAFSRGLNVLAISDHDLIAGVKAAQAEAHRLNELLLAQDPEAPVENFIKANARILGVTNGTLERSPQERLLTVVPGIELSSTWNNEQIHIVGLFVDVDNPELTNLIARHKLSRHERAEAIGEKLERLGFTDARARCAAQATPGAAITRGNYARFIYSEGKAESTDAAFHKYLARGKPAYVQTRWSSVPEVVEAILAAGGVPVLAHPRRYHFTNHRLRRLCTDFKDCGGMALEVSSSQQKPGDRDYLKQLCEQFGFAASSGSDFHEEGPFRDLGQNIDLPESLTPVWRCAQAEALGISPDLKQRLVEVTYKKSPAEEAAAAAAAAEAARPAAARTAPGTVTITVFHQEDDAQQSAADQAAQS